MFIQEERITPGGMLATELDSALPGEAEQATKAVVTAELEEAKQFARTLDIEDVKRGDWFVHLLQKVGQAYDRNARAAYFQQKYPGLPADDIADILITVSMRYAGIVGGIAGATATASAVATLTSAGLTTSLLVGTIGAEMIYLARLQMRLVLDLSVVYDLQLNQEDPEDMLMVFGYALGVAPTDMIGKGLQQVASGGARTAARQIAGKGRLEALQSIGRRVGLKILQKTIIKYAAIVAAAAIGSSYNYLTTKSVGTIAKSHFKNRGRVTEELRLLVTRQTTYDLAFPAAVLFMAQVDGEVSPKETEMYRAMLSRMSFEDHHQVAFQKLLHSHDELLDAVAHIEDVEVKQSLLDVLSLMAAYDGQLTDEERQFLLQVAEHLHVPLDMERVERSAREFHAQVKPGLKERTTILAGHAASRFKGASAALKGAAGQAEGRLLKAVENRLKRRKEAEEEHA